MKERDRCRAARAVGTASRRRFHPPGPTPADRFLDWLVVLPPGLEKAHREHVRKLERQEAVPFLSNIEVEAMAKELCDGIERCLKLRFGAEGRKLMPRVRKVRTLEKLRRVHDAVFTAEKLSEVRRLLPRADRR